VILGERALRTEESSYDDFELRTTFQQSQGEIRLYKSEYPIAQCTKMRYFEVEVIENKLDVEIYVGIFNANEFDLPSMPASLEELQGATL
jgi:hypothetical protein